MESKTQIFRQQKTRNYTIVNNDILRRKDLSWKAKGILVYVLSLPNDWVIYLEEVMKHSTDGRDSFRSGWKELEKVGYVKRFAYKEKGVIKEWRTIVSERADLSTFSPETDNPEVEKPQVDYPEVEKPKLQSTNKQSTYEQITEDTKKITSAELTDGFSSIWKLYPKKTMRKEALAAFTKAVKKGTSIDDIKNGVENYVNHLESNKSWLKPMDGGRWFQKERWNDEYATPKKEANPYEDQLGF